MAGPGGNIYQDAGTVTAAVVEDSRCQVMAIRVTSINAGIRYWQVHDKATIPLSTEVPVIWFPLPAGTATAPATLELDERWFQNSVWSTNGLGWAFSTTSTTYTAATAADHTVTIIYRGA